MAASPRRTAIDLTHDELLCERVTAELSLRIWESTIPIAVKQGGAVRQHGTGTLLRIAQRHFIITAGHVFRDAFKLGLPLLLGSKIVGKGTRELGGNSYTSPETGAGHELDLAIQELDSQMLEHLKGFQFLGLADIDRNVSFDDDLYCICGYPTELATEATPAQNTVSLRKLVYLTLPFQGATNDLPGYNARFHVLMHAAKADAAYVGTPVAQMPKSLVGISGSGVWKTNLTRIAANHWQARDARLSAIQTSVYTQCEAIRGTVWNAVEAMISEVYPDLRPSLRLVLPA